MFYGKMASLKLTRTGEKLFISELYRNIAVVKTVKSLAAPVFHLVFFSILDLNGRNSQFLLHLMYVECSHQGI